MFSADAILIASSIACGALIVVFCMRGQRRQFGDQLFAIKRELLTLSKASGRTADAVELANAERRDPLEKTFRDMRHHVNALTAADIASDLRKIARAVEDRTGDPPTH